MINLIDNETTFERNILYEKYNIKHLLTAAPLYVEYMKYIKLRIFLNQTTSCYESKLGHALYNQSL